jgi:hypothetical protein
VAVEGTGQWRAARIAMRCYRVIRFLIFKLVILINPGKIYRWPARICSEWGDIIHWILV